MDDLIFIREKKEKGHTTSLVIDVVWFISSAVEKRCWHVDIWPFWQFWKIKKLIFKIELYWVLN